MQEDGKLFKRHIIKNKSGKSSFSDLFFTTPQSRIRSTAPLTRGAKDFGNRALCLPPTDGGGGFCEAKDGGGDVREMHFFIFSASFLKKLIL